MSNLYANIVLTIIALLLGAAVAKLYLPSAQEVGLSLTPPTRGEAMAIQKITDPKLRSARLADLRSRLPAIYVAGGNLEVAGSVDVDNTVEVEGEVSISRRDSLR